MFSVTAKWYDALYSFKDYKKEALEIGNLIKSFHPEAKNILDVACGTAEHAKHMPKEYHIDGVDINPEFIQIASAKNPHGSFYQGDMTAFKIPKKYDVILCLFSSIGYVKTLDNVKKTLTCFSNHLNNGGIIIIEPWFTKSTWVPTGAIHLLTGENDEGKICRMNISETEDSLSVINFHYLVGTKNGIHHLQEKHVLGLFSKEEMIQCFKDSKLSVEYNDGGPSNRGIYIGKKT